MIEVCDKMEQDPKERSMFKLLEIMTSCPHPERLYLDYERDLSPVYVYSHPEYKVKTLCVYINKEQAGYLDFVFTIDKMEEMAIQF